MIKELKTIEIKIAAHQLIFLLRKFIFFHAFILPKNPVCRQAGAFLAIFQFPERRVSVKDILS